MANDIRTIDTEEFYRTLDDYAALIAARTIAGATTSLASDSVLSKMLARFPAIVAGCLTRMVLERYGDDVYMLYAGAISARLIADVVTYESSPRVLARIVAGFPTIVHDCLVAMAFDLEDLGCELEIPA